jgi:nuclear pore complex protein Nup54
MDQSEEDLKKKLIELEKRAFDPVLGGRQEEIWARMSGVRERARILQEETEKLGKTIEQQQNGELLTEEDQKALEKLLKDYDRQLDHLKKWVDDTRDEYDEWETTKQSRPAKR